MTDTSTKCSCAGVCVCVYVCVFVCVSSSNEKHVNTDTALKLKSRNSTSCNKNEQIHKSKQIVWKSKNGKVKGVIKLLLLLLLFFFFNVKLKKAAERIDKLQRKRRFLSFNRRKAKDLFCWNSPQQKKKKEKAAPENRGKLYVSSGAPCTKYTFVASRPITSTIPSLRVSDVRELHQ